ncbi:hypothetical protein [Paenarthrobacter ureafaciens]|uniref:hypothetical protein n=1 Tax=Paenarthrobacter ureafaciens TaxID=37931 RepID=UPI0034DB6FF9
MSQHDDQHDDHSDAPTDEELAAMPGRLRRRAKRAARQRKLAAVKQARAEERSWDRREAPSPWPIIVAVALLLAGFLLIPRLLSGNGAAAESNNGGAASSSSATATPQPTTAQSYFMGDGPQAVETPSFPGHSPVTVPSPTVPAVDRSKPESVATAWAYVYHSVPRNGEYGYMAAAESYTAPELREFMRAQAGAANSALAGKAPTIAEDIQIKPAGPDAPADTPVRWSRTIEVTALSHEGSRTTLSYSVSLFLGEDGWSVTHATQNFWTVK